MKKPTFRKYYDKDFLSFFISYVDMQYERVIDGQLKKGIGGWHDKTGGFVTEGIVRFIRELGGNISEMVAGRKSRRRRKGG
jgi:hypothetical protein